ncbi:MAG: 2-oxo acid dehydrogenase subunit E2 [Fimbriimonadia bacterium]|jgi:pyruvate dehydrogenase E2 component (dihydrolipoamide acetyltransferase)
MIDVIMPKMGDGMEEGTLVEWLKKEGEKVATDEVIANIQTDKAVVELTSPGTGVLAGVLVKPDETVPVGTRIAAILQEGETLPSDWSAAAPSNGAPAEAAPAKAPEKTEPVSSPATGDRVKASPLAKKIAEAEGIDLSRVTGTGPGGRIVERDVRAFTTERPVAAVANPAGGVRKLSRLRQIIAERTQQAKRDAPHFYVTVEVDVEELFALREKINSHAEVKISVNDFVMKACALALREMPEVNSNFVDGEWVIGDSVNIGMAVATDEGLLVPVLKGCEAKSLRAISREAKDLAGRTRDGKVQPDELTGSTFSISNMGMLSVDNFTAILNTPNGAIVAVSTARRVPVVLPDDSIAPRWRMNLTGSFDHRTLDGAVGARFMNVVRDYLESPYRLLE